MKDPIISHLLNGGIVVHNTDTCLGMAVDITNKAAVEKLYKIKDMPLTKPVSILCDSIEMAQKYAKISPKARLLMQKYMPGQFTIILPRTDALPEWINPGVDSVGVRIVDDSLCMKMVSDLGNPVTTTSCNVSGEQVCLTDAQVKGVFGDYIDSGDILVAFEGQSTPAVSTIVKCENDSVTLIRQGAIDVDLK